MVLYLSALTVDGLDTLFDVFGDLVSVAHTVECEATGGVSCVCDPIVSVGGE